MSNTLWSPWRMDYILGPKPDTCVFCTALEDGPERYAENLVLAVEPHAYVIMNRFPYTHAHLMVVPKRHVNCLEALEPDEHLALFDLLVRAQTVLRRRLDPQGLNIGMNVGTAGGAGIKDHLHAHIVPRWHGDTNFMPLLADTRCMPEHLDDTYAALAEAFARLEPSRLR
jgi:ATP adenylyltransferase